MATAEQFVQKCLQEVGDEYEWGEAAQPGTDPSQTTEWDCSGLVYTKLHELGIDVPRSSTEQLDWVIKNGTAIPLDEGVRTRGALLLRVGHVAVSLGDGRTVEAMGEDYGVLVASTSQRGFTHAGRVPGLSYNGAAPDLDPSPTPVTRDPAPGRRPTLREGSRGDAVRRLQRKLTAQGFKPGPVDGDFGPATDSAVRAFQRAKGLVVDGIVGPKTWSALRPS
jgi:Putative peptidoglycan binding domain/NlpC/P60 family